MPRHPFFITCSFSEEFRLFSKDFAKAQVCQAAGTQTEQLIGQPFLS
jgi:hypothetical protein